MKSSLNLHILILICGGMLNLVSCSSSVNSKNSNDETNLYLMGFIENEKNEKDSESTPPPPPSNSGNCATDGFCDVDFNNDHIVDMQDVEHMRDIILCRNGAFFVEGKAYDLNDSQGDGDPTINVALENPNSPCMDSNQGFTNYDLQQFSQFVAWTQGQAPYPISVSACQCFLYANYPDGHACKNPKEHNAFGLGTDAKPYIIVNGKQLHDLAQNPQGLSKSYKQCSDVALTYSLPDDLYFTIGSSGQPFTGKYNGNDFEIANYTFMNQSPLYAGSPTNNIGLFGQTSGADIRNVTMTSVAVDMKTANSVGSLVGNAVGTKIDRVRVTTSIYGKSYVGGIVGKLDDSSGNPSIKNASSSGTVHATMNDVGGIAGHVVDGLLDHTASSASVVTDGYGFVGGLVGNSQFIEIRDSFSTGSISALSGTPQEMGGLVGRINQGGVVRRSYSSSTVNAHILSGGLVGDGKPSLIEDSYFSGVLVGRNGSCGGIVGGSQAPVLIQRVYVSGTMAPYSPFYDAPHAIKGSYAIPGNVTLSDVVSFSTSASQQLGDIGIPASGSLLYDAQSVCVPLGTCGSLGTPMGLSDMLQQVGNTWGSSGAWQMPGAGQGLFPSLPGAGPQ